MGKSQASLFNVGQLLFPVVVELEKKAKRTYLEKHRRKEERTRTFKNELFAQQRSLAGPAFHRRALIDSTRTTICDWPLKIRPRLVRIFTQTALASVGLLLG